MVGLPVSVMTIQFAAQQVDHARYTIRTTHSEPMKIGAADQHCLRTERKTALVVTLSKLAQAEIRSRPIQAWALLV